MLIKDSPMLFIKDNYLYFPCFDTLDEVTLIGHTLDTYTTIDKVIKVERVPYSILNNDYKAVKPDEKEYRAPVSYFTKLILNLCFDKINMASNTALNKKALWAFPSESVVNSSLLSYANKRKPYVITKDDIPLLRNRYITNCYSDSCSNLVISIERIGLLKKSETSDTSQIVDNINSGLTIKYGFKDEKITFSKGAYRTLDNLNYKNSFLSSKSEIALLKDSSSYIGSSVN